VNASFILLIEDRDEDIELTLRAFAKAEIHNEILVKRDALEALDFLDALAGGEPSARPTLILLDVNMPLMSGITLLDRIRAMDHLRSVPVVMLTSSNEERDLVAAYERGANSYLRKPVAHSEFAAMIARLGTYWIVTNETPGS
jgi:two-component system response regulator